MEKFLRESGFPIFGGNFYVASLNLDFWPPFCYCKSDFRIFCFSLALLDYFISDVNLSAKIHSGKYFSELGSIGTPLTTNGSQKYLDHLSVKLDFFLGGGEGRGCRKFRL